MPLEKLFVFDGNDGPPEKGIFALGIQRRPRPDNPQWKIPHSEWPEVLRRVGQVIPMMFWLTWLLFQRKLFFNTWVPSNWASATYIVSNARRSLMLLWKLSFLFLLTLALNRRQTISRLIASHYQIFPPSYYSCQSLWHAPHILLWRWGGITWVAR